MGDGRARLVGVERAARRVAAVATDGGIDAARARRGLPADEGEVAALDLALPNRFLQRRVRRVRARDYEEAGGVAVEPVDDARSLRVGPTGGSEREELRDQRPRPGPGAGVNDHPGRLVQHEQVLVLVADGDGDRLDGEGGVPL